jgi:hypothetical protein
MEYLIVLAILLIVVFVVSAPLRRERAAREGASVEAEGGLGRELAELEATRDAKYREIRDAELDHRTGKLSDGDFDALERELRAEAMEILRRLDRTRERAAATIGEQ